MILGDFYVFCFNDFVVVRVERKKLRILFSIDENGSLIFGLRLDLLSFRVDIELMDWIVVRREVVDIEKLVD